VTAAGLARDGQHSAGLPAALAREVARITALLDDGDPASSTPAAEEGALAELAAALALTPFERDVLLLCSAVELDGDAASAAGRAMASTDPHPAVGLALSRLQGAHWDAFLAAGPLRAWHLVEIAGDDALVSARVSVDERVLHHLLGLDGLDRRLHGVAVALPTEAPMYPSHGGVVEDVATALLAADAPAVVSIDGADESTLRAIAGGVLDALAVEPLGVVVGALPGPGSTLHDLVRLLDREWILSRRLPVLTRIEANPDAAAALVETTSVPVVVAVDGPAELMERATSRLVLHRKVDPPSPEEQRDLWHAVLDLGDEDGDGVRAGLSEAIDQVSQQHRMPAATIASVASEVRLGGRDDAAGTLLARCRERTRAGLDPLAQRVESLARWDDLVLPPGHVEVLRAIVRQLRHRTKVYEHWGFADRTSRGLGITALFFGESGTGKTLAAEVIANELSLDLYRVDLASTVSKYIGETSKNLARLFDAAEESGAILLFDEADALFGKRSEVKDSHDRYANLEMAYLLQRMESYRGLAILTTNLRSNLDRAFVRRLRFIVQFPFPDERQRADIWRRSFPARTPLEGIDPDALARLTIPGGSIWSIALGAAFAAAETGGAVTPAHVLEAARAEYAKVDRTLTDTELEAVR
jgi:vesicle-fusing ATPase